MGVWHERTGWPSRWTVQAPGAMLRRVISAREIEEIPKSPEEWHVGLALTAYAGVIVRFTIDVRHNGLVAGSSPGRAHQAPRRYATVASSSARARPDCRAHVPSP